MATSPRNGGGGNTFPVVVSTDGLQEIVDLVTDHGAFAFDIETRGVVERHPDVEEQLERAWSAHLVTLKAQNENVIARSREALAAKYRSSLALDPMRNEVIWLGIAIPGRSWAIPVGHRNGVLIHPGEVGDGSSVPPPGYRKVLASGKESSAKAKYVIPATFGDPPHQLQRSEVFEALRPIFMDDQITKIGHNVKFDARSLCKYLGDIPAGPYIDTMILQFVINENLREYGLASLISHNFDGAKPYARDGKVGAYIDSVSFDNAARYVHLDVRWTWMLYKRLIDKVRKSSGLSTSLKLDMDVLYVLMHAESTGISVDTRRMQKLGKELDVRKQQLLLDISQHAFLGFNPDSVAHKKRLLFAKKREGGLGLKPVGKTRTGADSVDEATLEALKDKHQVVPLLLEWAEASKLKSTYVDGLLPLLNKGRLHPSFNLHRAATGRLSSSNPNLQNIPRGSDLRGLFIAPEGETLLVADYDQIELRVMCMFSHDPKMSQFFLTGTDIHSGAASLILNKPIDQITSEERQIGKMVNFLTGFGGGAFNLAQKTGISEDRAQAFIDDYYRQFSALAEWKERIKAFARRKGYVETMAGRRRRLPDITSTDHKLRARAERQAVNAVIQGTAADICKEAMVKVHNAFAGTPARLLVQVHDELVCSTPVDSAPEMLEVLMRAMGHERVIEGIPLLVSAHSGYSWAEAKG